MPDPGKTVHAVPADEKIAQSVRRALKFDNEVPDERITVVVHDGLVTLEGNVETEFERDAAETDARKVKGVRGVVNRIRW